MIFGWCNTGHHDLCRYFFKDWNDKPNMCSCGCHNTESDQA